MFANQHVLKTVVVAKSKGRVHFLSFGSHPHARIDKHVTPTVEPRGQALIPNGLKVRTTCSAREWELETRVLDSGAVEYTCICVEHPNVSGGWHDSASMAYVETNKELVALGLGSSKFRKSENGALLIGITYPNVQRELRAYLEREHPDPAMTPRNVKAQETPNYALSSEPQVAPMDKFCGDGLTIDKALRKRMCTTRLSFDELNAA